MRAAYREALQLQLPPHVGSGMLRSPKQITTWSELEVTPVRETRDVRLMQKTKLLKSSHITFESEAKISES